MGFQQQTQKLAGTVVITNLYFFSPRFWIKTACKMSHSREDCPLSSFILWNTGTEFRNNDVTLCTINGITIIFAFLSNLIIALAMKKRNLVRTPCHILNFSLTLVDCVATLVARPLYIDLRLALYDNRVTCYTLHQKAKVTESAIMFFVGCSLVHMVCIARDRCNALCQPLLYRTDRKMKGELCTLVAF